MGGVELGEGEHTAGTDGIEFKLQSLQIAFFYKGISIPDRLEVATGLVKASGKQLDGTPTILPVDSKAPAEIPRIMLRSKDGSLRCGLSMERCDLFLSGDRVTLKTGNELEFDSSIPAEVHKHLVNIRNARVNRVAIIATTVCSTGKTGARYIIEEYTAGLQKWTSPDDVELNIYNKMPLGSFEVNRWIRFASARAVKDKSDNRYVHLVIDINSIEQEGNIVTEPRWAEFIAIASEEVGRAITDAFDS